MNTATSETEIEITVKPICAEPSRAARSGDLPSSKWRMTFSIITMASSTTKPTAMVSAISEKLLTEKPNSHIAARLPASDSGTVTAAARVGTRRRMNTSTTSSTRAQEISSEAWTSATLARMVWVRSDRMVSSTSGGIQLRSSGSTDLMRSTVSITLASPVLLICSRIAGWVPSQAARRILATPSITSATSPRRTTPPPGTVFSTSGRYSAATASWPFNWISAACSAPSKPPVGPLTLLRRMAL